MCVRVSEGETEPSFCPLRFTFPGRAELRTRPGSRAGPVEALRRGAHNFPPPIQPHLQRHHTSPVRAAARTSGGSTDRTKIHTAPQLHFTEPKNRVQKRPPPASLTALRRPAAGVLLPCAPEKESGAATESFPGQALPGAGRGGGTTWEPRDCPELLQLRTSAPPLLLRRTASLRVRPQTDHTRR